MLYFTFFLTISFTIYGFYLLRAEKASHLKKRMSAFVGGIKEEAATQDEKTFNAPLYDRIGKPLLNDFKRSFKKRMPGEKEAKIETKLQLAGSPFGMTPVDFRLLQISLALVFPILAGVYGAILNAGYAGVFMFFLVGLAAGSVLPHYYLSMKKKARNKSALKELPDILDLLTVSLEAGLGFDSAVSKVVSKKDGVLSAEFHRSLEELRLGRTRREALTGIKNRIEVEEVRAFISSILQAEKLGIGMVQVLRVQSNEVRDRRRQRAEEEAMKAPVKMLFPLVLFIFPTIFIVLLGPALIQFLQTFSK
ncbi:type II secretion system F family protein [Mesobacillus boroniphilus]|uniref:Type II secretion system F family protein n=1 Tax=Mesobacillus boroniphilus TaxID=308892 RepID=A0A944CNS0_9BACI|nr:type II secretion system F family protein [Mesobacillus boroniphilus]MBS8266157.1 type II secretion system F family protein [Mesobacillus boroniphilus]